MAHVLDLGSAHAVRGGGFAALRAGLLTALRRRAVYGQTLAELGRLSDRDLADLGIARKDLRRVARDAADQTIR